MRGASTWTDPVIARYPASSHTRPAGVLGVWRLGLGKGHVDHALDVIDARGRRHRLVLRRWARPGWRVDDPDYRRARSSTLVPAPSVLGADPAGVQCDVPAILLNRLAGHPPSPADAGTEGFCRQLAETLYQIHDVEGAAQRQLDPYRLYYDWATATPPGGCRARRCGRRRPLAVPEPPATTRSLTTANRSPTGS
jgi:hypothetical protein